MVSMANWSSAILRYSDHVQAGIQYFFCPVPCWAQLGLKTESPVLCPSLVGRVQWSGLPFIREVQVSGDYRTQINSCEK